MNGNINTPCDIEVFKKLKIGDVIWARRTMFLNSKERIPCGHKVGPYVVVGRKNRNVICFYATSVEPKTEVMRSYTLFIPKQEEVENGFTKDTYIDVHRVINVLSKDFVRYTGTLTDIELHKLNKKIGVLKSKGVYALQHFSNLEYPLEMGDVVWYENAFYLVLETRKKAFISTMLKEVQDECYSSKIVANGIPYYYDSNSIVAIRRERKPVRIGFVESDKELEKLAQMSDKIKELEELKRTKKGSIIAYKRSLFYVYGENGENWQMLRVYSNEDPDMALLSIGGVSYYTDFLEHTEVLKGIVLHRAIGHASEEEIQGIKQVRKMYKARNSAMASHLKFKTGDIITDSATRTQEYLVLLPYPDRMVVVKKEDMYTRNYRLMEIGYKRYSIVSSLNGMLVREILDEIRNTGVSKHAENELKMLVKQLEGNVEQF